MAGGVSKRSDKGGKFYLVAVSVFYGIVPCACPPACAVASVKASRTRWQTGRTLVLLIFIASFIMQ